ncbi:MAG: DUF929 family protein [Chloroflexi bacterium]|nr:DUF929 family protein [Chloroflexota bacterium]
MALQPTPGDKVPVFFMGAQFCPYCAVERWALVSALQSFGSLTDFGKEASNEGVDGFHPVPTYNLIPAHYSSPYVTFSSKDIFDHNSQPLQKLDATEQDYVNRFDPHGDWPFIVINGQYAQIGNGFSPSVLQGMQFDPVFQQLQAGALNPATQAIEAEAAVLRKYICASTAGLPSAACHG